MMLFASDLSWGVNCWPPTNCWAEDSRLWTWGSAAAEFDAGMLFIWDRMEDGTCWLLTISRALAMMPEMAALLDEVADCAGWSED